MIIQFLRALPELIALIKSMSDLAEGRGETNKQVKEDLKKLNKAVKEKDEKAINDLFNKL